MTRFKKRKYIREYIKNRYHNDEEFRKRFLGYVKKSRLKNYSKISKRQRIYNAIPQVKERRNRLRKSKYKSDESFRRKRILYVTFRRYLVKFHKGNFIIKEETKQRFERVYGIDFEKIIYKLLPLPINLKDYEIDHIIPLNKFDFTKREEIEKAYSPKNIRLISALENKKRDRN